MRILVTGSRDWNDFKTLTDALDTAAKAARHAEYITVIHGSCPTGADQMADNYARSQGWKVIRYPADWNRFGRSAGPLRNAFMVGKGADICLAFIKNNSRGATGCANLAEWGGISVARYEEN